MSTSDKQAALWLPRTYAAGARNLWRVIRREPEAAVKVTKVRRIARNYVEADVTLARRLLGVSRHYIRIVREVGLGDNDEYVIGWLHALPLSLASQSFSELYDEMLSDERITDDERDLIASAVLDCQAVEVAP